MSWIPNKLELNFCDIEKANAQAFIDKHAECLSAYAKESAQIREFAPSAMVSYRISSSSFAFHVYIRCDRCKEEECIDNPEHY